MMYLMKSWKKFYCASLHLFASKDEHEKKNKINYVDGAMNDPHIGRIDV